MQCPVNDIQLADTHGTMVLSRLRKMKESPASPMGQKCTHALRSWKTENLIKYSDSVLEASASMPNVSNPQFLLGPSYVEIVLTTSCASVSPLTLSAE